MLKRLTFVPLFALVVFALSACDHPNPLAPAKAIGEFPEWGIAFTEEQKGAAKADSLLSPGAAPGAAKTPSAASSKPAGAPAAQADATYGKQVFTNLCARCHRGGEGGAMPMIGMVPNFTLPAWQSRMGDAQITATIVNGKGKMPAFKLGERELSSLVAHIRTLKK